VPRFACVDVAELPIQALLRARPDWARGPAAVVDKDSPQGILLFVNEHARKHGMLPGQRYAAAFGLCVDLRAAAIERHEIDQTVEEIARLLVQFSPRIEPMRERPGTFFVDASGLDRLEPSLERWALRIVLALRAVKLTAAVAVGFTRFGSFAAAQLLTAARKSVHVFASADDEHAFVQRAPLARLHVPPPLRDRLALLGIHTVGAFAALPESGVRARFGVEAQHLHDLAHDRVFDPLSPTQLQEPLERRVVFDLPVYDTTSLLFVLKQALEDLIEKLAARDHALETFTLALQPERGGKEPVLATLKPATPTLDLMLLLQLATLHFERSPPAAARGGIEEVVVTATSVPARPETLALFKEHRTRDLDAGTRALALVRSRFGADSVRRVVLREGHLPEASFRFEPLDRLALAAPTPMLEHCVIRRVLDPPVPLSPPRRHQHDDGWIVHDLQQGAVVKCDGPYVISGGWWAREIHREYLYVHTLRGDVLWVYLDKKRRRWFLQGEIE
jgi:protein ImuB